MENFDYLEAVKRLEEIAGLVEDPGTSLDDMDSLMKESAALVEKCRSYLRGMRDKMSSDEEKTDI